jgi:ATP-dependent RNA helicase DDX5/DBP2
LYTLHIAYIAGYRLERVVFLLAAVPLLTAAQLMGKTVLDTDMPAGAAAAAAADHADTSVTPLEALNRLAASASTAAADGDGSTAAADSSLSAYDPLIQGAMRQLKFNEATPVQAAVWAAACRGQDVQAVAEPGTGKTLAYLLPALVRVHQLLQQELGAGSHATSSSRVEPLVLVVAPSRELAQQVWGVCKRLYAATRLSSAVVYGGVDKQEQLALLQRRRPLLLAATPGRLLDLLDSSSSGAAGAEAQQQQQGGLSLARVQLLVLDEADKMLSVGFRPQLERIAAQLALLGPPAADGTASGGGGNAAEEPEKRKKKKKQAKGLAMQQQGGRQRPQVSVFVNPSEDSQECYVSSVGR